MRQMVTEVLSSVISLSLLSPLSLYSADVQRSLSVAPYLETAQWWEHPPVNLVK